MSFLFYSIACLAILNAGRLTWVKAAIGHMTNRIGRAKPSKVRCTFAA